MCLAHPMHFQLEKAVKAAEGIQVVMVWLFKAANFMLAVAGKA